MLMEISKKEERRGGGEKEGRVIHIDFGDCFEVANHRDKYPEKIPFRLTRMLVNAMEVSGIDGTFRSTSETVMQVLRKNKNSVMAVLEAFVYDPLINWRLLETTTKEEKAKQTTNTSTAAPPKNATESIDEVKESAPNVPVPTEPREHHRPNELVVGSAVSHTSMDRRRSVVEIEQQENRLLAGSAHDDEAEAMSIQNEQLNDKAVQVIARVDSKLKGTDFGAMNQQFVLDVGGQVQRLIVEATSHINLCQCYIGWCPFW